MNRKHNPFVALVGLLLGLLLVILCAGCGATTETPEPGEPTEESRRFTVEKYAPESSSIFGDIYSIRVITDTETGVQYLAYIGGQGTGLTVLQEKEG